MGYFKWLSPRTVIIFLSVLAVVYLCNIYTGGVDFRADKIQQAAGFSLLAVTRQPHSHDVLRLDEGNFTLWARKHFKPDVLPTATTELYQTEDLVEKEGGINILERNHGNSSARGNDGSGLLGGSHESSGEPLAEDYKTSGSSSDGLMDTPHQSSSSSVTLQWHTTKEKQGDNHPILTGNNNNNNGLIEKLNLTSLLPRGGNTLPNYLLHGIDRGLLPKHYQHGVLAFLHHNKAAGSSIKVCFTKLINRNILKKHKLLVFSSKIISRIKTEEIVIKNAFAGGYTFWLCELYPGQNCSYFTILRDPYDRVISSYYYCKVQDWDQLCGPLTVGNFTLQEWAIYQGSYFFYQLLMQNGYCRQNEVIRDMFQNGGIDFIPQGTLKYIDYKDTFQCWFKQRVYLSNVLNETAKEYVLDNVLDNLESWFSVVGLTEEFDLSLKMLSVTYHLPFYGRCRGKQVNSNPSQKAHKDSTKERDRAILQSSAEVREALRYDVKIYQRGVDIFERQKQRLNDLSGAEKEF